jgi:hypothetical protein
MAKIFTAKGHVIQIDDETIDSLCGYVWHVTSAGYVATNIEHPFDANKTTLMSMHRLLMGLKFGDRQLVDHINGDKLDNRLENIRLCTNQQNQRNQRLCQSNTSGFKGVWFSARKNIWVAGFKRSGKNVYIGEFRDKMAAAHAYNRAVIQEFGDFAVLNPVWGTIELDKPKKRKHVLTELDVISIKKSIEPGRILAMKFAVNRRTIDRIRNGTYWKDVD